MARQRVPSGPPAPPPVQRLRVRYARRGRLRFSSGRDFQRALERALRLAGAPMAYSSGFHPHPRISYANAAPTGVASEAEYVELALAQRVDPAELVRAVDAALPAGLDLVEAVEAVEAGRGSLADRLEASHWRFAFPARDADDVREALAAFLRQEHIEVTRVTKSGPKTFDVRGPVLSATLREPAGAPADLGRSAPVSESGSGAHQGDSSTVRPGADVPGDEVKPLPGQPCAILETVVRHTTPAVRPDDFLSALRSIADLEPSSPPLVTRLAQGPLTGEPPRVADPLAAERNLIGTSER